MKSSLIELINYISDKSKLLDFYCKQIYTMDKPDEYKNALFILTQSTMFGYNGMSILELSKELARGDTTTRKIVKMLEADELLLVEKARPVLYKVNLEQFSEN